MIVIIIAVVFVVGLTVFILYDGPAGKNDATYNDKIEIYESENVNDTDVDKCDFDKIYEYKELLDMGAITQEEFDVKKKELLKL